MSRSDNRSFGDHHPCPVHWPDSPSTRSCLCRCTVPPPVGDLAYSADEGPAIESKCMAPEFTPHSHCCPDMTRRFPRQRTSFLKAFTLWPRKVSPAPSTPTNRCNSDLRCGHAHARAPCPWRGAVCALHCLVPTCSHTTHHVSTPTSDSGDIACLSVMYSSSFLSDDSQRATTLAFAHPLRVFRQVARRWRASCTARIQVNQRGWHPSREHRCGITRAHRPT